MRIYIAAPMFSEAEKTFNLVLDERLREALDVETYLPQRDAGEAAALIRRGLDEDRVRRRLFEADCTAMERCRLLVFVVDGRVPDEGGCVELGMAYAQGTQCFGLQTDVRRFGGTDSNNLMIDHALTGGIAHSIEELIQRLATHLRTRDAELAIRHPRRGPDEHAIGARR